MVHVFGAPLKFLWSPKDTSKSAENSRVCFRLCKIRSSMEVKSMKNYIPQFLITLKKQYAIEGMSF